MERVIRNDKVIINQNVMIKKDILEEIKKDIQKQFEEERIVFIPFGLTAQVACNEVVWEEKHEQ